MFRLVSVDGRAALQQGDDWFDLAALAGDATLADPMVAVARSEELHELQLRCSGTAPSGSISDAVLDAPVPSPRQVFGIGLNYRDHAGESGMALPPAPLTFTKFPSSIAGPTADIPLSGTMVDWEVELVVVIGRTCTRVARADAWQHVAGLTVGQDVSDRAVQLTGTPPQFSLGKSFAAYSPIGPAVVSPDSLGNRDDLEVWCDVSGVRKQSARSSLLIFDVPTLVAYLSSICVLYPGDLIFTGTPSGVGMATNTYLTVGDVIDSGIEGIGSLRNVCVAGAGPMVL